VGAWDFHSLEGLARSLDGTDDYFSRAHEAALSAGAADFAIAVWVYPTADTAMLVVKGTTGAHREYSLELKEVTGTDSAIFSVSTNGWDYVTVSAALGALNTWHHIVAWYDQSTPNINISVDNAAAVTVALGVPAAVTAVDEPLVLGAWDAWSGLLAGRITKCGLWIGSYPTTAQWTTLYNSGKGLTRYTLPDALLTNLVDWWDGDELAGSNLLGAVNGYDLTKAGAPGSAAGPDVADVLSLAHPHGPGVSVEIGSQSNVVVAETVGGRLRSQERGGDRRTYVLPFPAISATHKGYLDTWWARYGGAREPFLLELPDGTRLRVRAPQTRLTYAHLWSDYYRATIELVEDLI